MTRKTDEFTGYYGYLVDVVTQRVTTLTNPLNNPVTFLYPSAIGAVKKSKYHVSNNLRLPQMELAAGIFT